MTEEQKKLVAELEEFLLKLGNEPIILGTGIEYPCKCSASEFRFDIDSMTGAWTWWIPYHNLQIRCTLGWDDEWLRLPFEIDKGELLHMDHMIVGDIKTLPRLVNFYFNSLNRMYSDWLKNEL